MYHVVAMALDARRMEKFGVFSMVENVSECI
jgi:hypothetical protein